MHVSLSECEHLGLPCEGASVLFKFNSAFVFDKNIESPILNLIKILTLIPNLLLVSYLGNLFVLNIENRKIIFVLSHAH